MKSQRSLVLKKETLTDLTPAQLASVAGGQVTALCLTQGCFSGTCVISELMYPCLTTPTI